MKGRNSFTSTDTFSWIFFFKGRGLLDCLVLSHLMEQGYSEIVPFLKARMQILEGKSKEGKKIKRSREHN